MSSYWQKRYEAIEEGLYRLGDAHIEDLEQEYNKAIKELQRKIEVFYGRFANNNSVSINDAKKMLSAKELKELRWTLSEYIKFGKANSLDGRWVKQLENASIRARIERLQMLELQVRQELEILAAYKEQGLTKLLGAEYKEGYYRSIYEVQKNAGMGTAFQTLPSREVNIILSKAWAPDGKNFSSRIWTDKNQMINNLTSELTQGFIIGRSAEEMMQRISERMNVSKRNAMRLVRTESSYFANASFQASYKEMGIEQQIFVATLDTKTSATCREMDGKIIATSDVKPGINAPPLHAYCRSVMSPYFEGNIIERAARNKDGKTYSVPGDITYKKWYNEYVLNRTANENVLIGLQAKNGLVVTGLSEHILERLDARKLSASNAKDALENPLHIGDIKIGKKGPSQEFVGRSATIAINPDTGNIITVHGTHSKVVKKYDHKVE